MRLTGPKEAGRVRATPAVRRMARNLGIELQVVRGTGPDGRVTERDLRAFVDEKTQAERNRSPSISLRASEPTRMSPVARRMAEAQGADMSQVKPRGVRSRINTRDVRAYLESGREGQASPGLGEADEWLNLTRAQQTTGRRMLQSVQTAPQFSLTSSVDMTQALEFREAVSTHIEAEAGARPSVTAILVKVVADVLSRYTRINASYVDGRVKLHREVNIGVAVSTGRGLLVPVIRNADKKSLADTTRELVSLQEKASRMHFGASDLSGATFTISNLGMYGIDQFNAIINLPESAIMAVGRIIRTPVGMPDESIALRPMMNVTLSIDHRCLDGQQGAEFLSLVKRGLEQLGPNS